MRIGILGSGLMGGKLGTLFARAGHDVVFSYARTRKKLESFAREAGHLARAGTPGEAAAEADALLLAVHWSRMEDVLSQAGDLSGKTIVTCSLPMNARAIRNILRRRRRVGVSGNMDRRVSLDRVVPTGAHFLSDTFFGSALATVGRFGVLRQLHGFHR